MGKYSLLVIGGLVFAAGTITSNLNQVSEYFVDDVIEHYERAEAGLVANSMAHMSLAMLKDSSSWRGGYNGIAIGEGTGWSTLDDNTTDTTLIAGLVRITAWGTSGGTADTATVIVKFPTILPGVCAGVTAHSDVVGRGNMVIDGRNHDLNGIVIAGEGTFGVSTVATLTQSGNAKVGGTAAGMDYPPSKSPPSSIIEENATCDGACDGDSKDSDSKDKKKKKKKKKKKYSDSKDSDSKDTRRSRRGRDSKDSDSKDSDSKDSDSEDSDSKDRRRSRRGRDSKDGDSKDGDSTDVACATSPDAIFGYASGTLKALAQAGANGSQYATDPARLTFPLSSVTYVELADGATWSAIDFGASSGVLVVHNSACNATMKNLKGTFKGLIISDDIEKVHTTVIGAVVSMTQSPSGNCIGNGNGEVLYSIAALENASSVSGGGGGELTVVSWLE